MSHGGPVYSEPGHVPTTLSQSEVSAYQETHRITFTLGHTGVYGFRITDYNTGRGMSDKPTAFELTLAEFSRTFAERAGGQTATWDSIGELVNACNGPNLTNLMSVTDEETFLIEGPREPSYKPGTVRPPRPEVFELILKDQVSVFRHYEN